MANVNFSVPDEVKEQFNRAFARGNRSRVIARLMMQAIEERKLQRTRARAIDALLKRRRKQKPITEYVPNNLLLLCGARKTNY